MPTVNFMMIEDSRFPNKPDIETMITQMKTALDKTEYRYAITEPRRLTWDDGTYQFRVDVSVHYHPRTRGARQDIMRTANNAVPNTAFRFE